MLMTIIFVELLTHINVGHIYKRFKFRKECLHKKKTTVISIQRSFLFYILKYIKNQNLFKIIS